jgi:uncharacterized protein
MTERIMLKYRRLSGFYAIVRMSPHEALPKWAIECEFTSITRTADELSIVCPTQNLPPDVHSSHRWICFQLEGPFAFSQTGILLSFIEPLSNNGVPIFAVSTFDTDYVLVQEEFVSEAQRALERGHELIGG